MLKPVFIFFSVRQYPAACESSRSLRYAIVRTLLLVLAATTAAALIFPGAAHAEQARAADNFVNSVGVNIHLSYQDTLYYQNFNLISASLRALGVRHVRDGIPASPPPEIYERFNKLAQEGVHVDLITSTGQDTARLAVQHGITSAVENFEAPNESDRDGVNWLPTLRGYLPVLSRDLAAAHGKPGWKQIIGPSLTQYRSYALLGDVDRWSTYANLHNYFSGFNPGTGGWGDNGYGSIAWNLKNVAVTNPGQPVMTTETGYDSQSGVPGSIPQSIAARYMPRLLLEQWNHGICRTYLYELLSSGGEDYGLLSRKGVEKPAFRAVANLLSILNDPGIDFAPGSLNYSVSGAKSDVHHALFEKRDGSFYLAMWVEEPGWNVNTHSPIEVAPQRVTIAFEQPVRAITASAFNDNGGVTHTTMAAAPKIEASATDDLTVFHIVLRREPEADGHGHKNS